MYDGHVLHRNRFLKLGGCFRNPWCSAFCLGPSFSALVLEANFSLRCSSLITFKFSLEALATWLHWIVLIASKMVRLYISVNTRAVDSYDLPQCLMISYEFDFLIALFSEYFIQHITFFNKSFI